MPLVKILLYLLYIYTWTELRLLVVVVVVFFFIIFFLLFFFFLFKKKKRLGVRGAKV